MELAGSIQQIERLEHASGRLRVGLQHKDTNLQPELRAKNMQSVHLAHFDMTEIDSQRVNGVSTERPMS